MIDFKTLALIKKAKRLAPFVPRFLGISAMNPQPLNLNTPEQDDDAVRVCCLLAKSSVNWLDYLRGSILSYRKAGMNLDLCSYAAARDALQSLASLEQSRKVQSNKGATI